jgi:serine/threonine-protein kinase
MTDAHDPRVGTNLGPYHIESVIGRGGMGVVYLAEQPSLERKVAVKILAPAFASDAGFRSRFINESKMAAAIDDPNILPVYEAGEIDGQLFIAMRYVEGSDLEARLRSGELTAPSALRVLDQVASALDAAHDRGLIHRDVKPANILIADRRAESRGEHAYLADFGLTKSQGAESGLTRIGSIAGTLDYIAPEQLAGRTIDGRADQYALAAIAFRAVTGHLPFERDTDVAIIAAHLNDPPPSARAIRADLPMAVDAVIARGMAKEPADRFPNCADFVTTLRAALDPTGVKASGSWSSPHSARPSSPAAEPLAAQHRRSAGWPRGRPLATCRSEERPRRRSPRRGGRTRTRPNRRCWSCFHRSLSALASAAHTPRSRETSRTPAREARSDRPRTAFLLPRWHAPRPRHRVRTWSRSATSAR